MGECGCIRTCRVLGAKPPSSPVEAVLTRLCLVVGVCKHCESGGIASESSSLLALLLENVGRVAEDLRV